VLLLGPVKTFANSDGDEDRDEATRWVPAIGVNWGLAFQETRATVASSVLSGSDPPEFVRPPATGTTTMFTPFVGGQFELMTPRLIGRFGQPRFFARVDLNAAWGFSYDVAREGSPGELIRPETGLPEGDVIGQGSVTNATVETFMLGAGGGVAFTIDKGGRRFRIRPSVEYLREQLRIRGVVNRAVSLEPGELLPTNFRFIEMEAEQTHTYHSIGPGVEIEVDAARLAPFTMTAFTSVKAYALLNNDVITLQAEFEDQYGTESAQWTFEKSGGWIYSVTLGVRLRWLPD